MRFECPLLAAESAVRAKNLLSLKNAPFRSVFSSDCSAACLNLVSYDEVLDHNPTTELIGGDKG
jgi:hypothetical protein